MAAEVPSCEFPSPELLCGGEIINRITIGSPNASVKWRQRASDQVRSDRICSNMDIHSFGDLQLAGNRLRTSLTPMLQYGVPHYDAHGNQRVTNSVLGHLGDLSQFYRILCEKPTYAVYWGFNMILIKPHPHLHRQQAYYFTRVFVFMRTIENESSRKFACAILGLMVTIINDFEFFASYEALLPIAMDLFRTVNFENTPDKSEVFGIIDFLLDEGEANNS